MEEKIESDDMNDYDKENEERKSKGVSERECEQSFKGDEVKAECSAKEGKVKDKIKFVVQAKKGCEVEVTYTGKNETDVVETEIEQNFVINCHSLVEYVPNNTETGDEMDLGYDFGDEVVYEIPFDEWTAFSEITQDESGVSHFHVTTEDNAARFDFHLSQKEDAVRDFSANSIKIDFSIANYTWMQNDTLLALICTIEAETEIEVDYEESKESKDDEETDDADKGDGKEGDDDTKADAKEKKDSEEGEDAVENETEIDEDIEEVSGIENEGPEQVDFELSGDDVEIEPRNAPDDSTVSVPEKKPKKKSKHPKDVRISLKGSSSSAAEAFGTFNWVTEYSYVINNITDTGTVVATNNEEEDKKKQSISFSFLNSNAADFISWDPKAGIGYAATSDADADAGAGAGKDSAGVTPDSSASFSVFQAVTPVYVIGVAILMGCLI